MEHSKTQCKQGAAVGPLWMSCNATDGFRMYSLGLAACRVTSMDFPPHVPLPVPEGLPPLPEVPNLGRKGLGLMTLEEEESNQQLYHAVRLLLCPKCWHTEELPLSRTVHSETFSIQKLPRQRRTPPPGCQSCGDASTAIKPKTCSDTCASARLL